MHNGANQIRQSIDSVLAQAGVNLELIVVDDGSDAATKEVLANYRKTTAIRMVEQANHGLTKALIIGCSLARYPLIARLDVGDVMLPGRLKAQAELLDQNPRVALVTSTIEMATSEGYPLYSVSYSAKELRRGLSSPLLAGGKTPAHASVMFRRDVYAQVGGYRPQFYFAQDLDLWTRLSEAGEVVSLDDCLTRTALAPNSLSSRYAKEQKELARIIAGLIECRRLGDSEQPLLAQAEKIMPSASSQATDTFAGHYFIGKCLLDRGSPHAKKYLKRALRERPLSLKAWFAFTNSLMRRAR